ncbi:hypothetical protein CC2G_008343 [Coprinopsis cinerea AmutBmut pab1-1]|nr:hypothetical protein CC2G_008343 [Coprinopsis cinerea AmutBmut pab1-1]
MIVYPLFLILLGKAVVSVVLLQIQLDSTIFFDPFSFEPIAYGCRMAATQFVSRWVFMIVFISEFLTVAATMVKAVQHLRQSNSSWVSELYKNGIMFSVSILLLSFFNMLMPELVVGLHLPPPYIAILAPFQSTMESVLCNRVMFIILKQRRLNAGHEEFWLSEEPRAPSDNLSSEGIFTSVYESTGQQKSDEVELGVLSGSRSIQQ